LAQNASGSASASAYTSVLEISALAVNSAGGGNVRPSASSDSIVSVFSAIHQPPAGAASASGVTLRVFPPPLASAHTSTPFTG
jgi:hypothetical protein